jgi:hypothetical protein
VQFRSLGAILKAQKYFNIISESKTPSHTTLRRWINLLGYFKLTRPKEKADDWAYFIDNSMRMENRKVCLILGCRLSKIKNGKCISFSDIEPIEKRIISNNNELEKILEDAIAKTGIPKQICSDSGSDLCSIKKIIAKHPTIHHIPDIMHKTGNLLKKFLDNYDPWKMFIRNITECKKRLCLSSLSHMCPPDIRGKSRFLNCRNVLTWGIRALAVLENLQKSDPCWQTMHEKLGWLIDSKQDLLLFVELFDIAAVSKEMIRKLHLEKETWLLAEEMSLEIAKSDKGKEFMKEVIVFLKEQCAKTNETDLLLGSSEIIESAFSKLKMLDRECGNSGFTQSILGLSACFGTTDYETVATAFKKCTFKDVELWNKKYVGETIQKKRRRILKSVKNENWNFKLTRFLERKKLVA